MKRIHSSNWHLAILIVGLLLFLLAYIFVRGQLLIEQVLVLGACGYYFIWGIIHHIYSKDLHFKIVLEYLSIAILGALLLLGLIART